MALHQCKVRHLVRCELRLFLHLAEPRHRIMRPPGAAVPLDENVVGDHVRTHLILRGHCVEHVDGGIKKASVNEAVEKAVVDQPGRLDACEAHGLPRPQELLGEAESREAADQRRRRRRREVPQGGVPVRAQLGDELPRVRRRGVGVGGGLPGGGGGGVGEGAEQRDVAAHEMVRVGEEVGGDGAGEGAVEVERGERVGEEVRRAERGGDEGRGEAEEEGRAEGAEVGGERGGRGAEDEGDDAGEPRRRGGGRGGGGGGVRAGVREVGVRLDPLRRRERRLVGVAAVGSGGHSPAERNVTESPHWCVRDRQLGTGGIC